MFCLTAVNSAPDSSGPRPSPTHAQDLSVLQNGPPIHLVLCAPHYALPPAPAPITMCTKHCSSLLPGLPAAALAPLTHLLHCRLKDLLEMQIQTPAPPPSLKRQGLLIAPGTKTEAHALVCTSLQPRGLLSHPQPHFTPPTPAPPRVFFQISDFDPLCESKVHQRAFASLFLLLRAPPLPSFSS